MLSLRATLPSVAPDTIPVAPLHVTETGLRDSPPVGENKIAGIPPPLAGNGSLSVSKIVKKFSGPAFNVSFNKMVAPAFVYELAEQIPPFWDVKPRVEFPADVPEVPTHTVCAEL